MIYRFGFLQALLPFHTSSFPFPRNFELDNFQGLSQSDLEYPINHLSHKLTSKHTDHRAIKGYTPHRPLGQFYYRLLT